MDALLLRSIKVSLILHAAFLLVASSYQCIRNLTFFPPKPRVVTFIDTRISGSPAPVAAQKAVPQVAAKKPQPVPPKKEAEKKKPKEIEIAKKEKPAEPKVVPNKNKKKTKPTTVAKKQPSPPSPPAPPPPSAKELRDIFSSAVPASSSRTIAGTGGTRGELDDLPASYYASVRQIMYDAWEQPSRATIPAGRIASVRIRIARDGHIIKSDMTIPSGVAILDDSILRAIQSVKQLGPLPPSFRGSYKEITIDFELAQGN